LLAGDFDASFLLLRDVFFFMFLDYHHEEMNLYARTILSI